MQRWIIPASVFAILISLAALVILLAASAGSQSNIAEPQDDAQIEESETSPQTTPEQETTPGGLTQPEEDPAAEDEQPLGGGGQTTQEEQPLGGGQTTQEEQTPSQAPVAPGPSTATIRVTGDSAYYCSLGVIGEPETVQGRNPESYEVDVETGGTALDTVMAACQKISPGTLGVRIIYDGEVVARDQTDARLGTVSVSWNPLAEEL